MRKAGQNNSEVKQKSSSASKAHRIKIVFFLSSCYLVSSVIIVLATGSLALLSEAGHMFADVGGLALALFAISYTRKEPTPERTYGFFRMEILASLANSMVLILLSGYIFYEGFRRLFEPPEMQSFPIIIAAAIGLLVNFIGMRLLSQGNGHGHNHSHGFNITDNKKKKISKEGENPNNYGHNHDYDHNHENSGEGEEHLNTKAVYLETLSDTIGAAGVLGAGIIMLTTKFYLADPIVSIGLSLFMLPRTWIIIKKAIHILMEGAPSTIPTNEIKNEILGIRGVTGLFELHIWTITSGMHALSAHVVVMDISRSQEILQQINSILEKKFGITHSTIQIERYHSEACLFKP